MNAHTNNVQIIQQNGQPAFGVIPYDEFLELVDDYEEGSTIPHAVVGLVIENGWNLLKAWRKHLELSQKELATWAGISQPALSQMERSENLRNGTVDKLAAAMGIKAEQLVDCEI